MISTSQAVYATTIKEFFEDVERNRFVEKMKDYSPKFCIIPQDSEINSWEKNSDELRRLLASSNLPDDVVIVFEYVIPTGGGRIDCMLFGEDKDGKSNVVHMELKQWSNENVTAYYDYHTLKADVLVDGYKQGNEITCHPSEQAEGYHNTLLNYVKFFDKENTSLYGYAYCYNYLSNAPQCALLDTFYNEIMHEIPLYCKNQKDELAKELNQKLGGGSGECVYNDFVNSAIEPTKRLYDVAANMLNNEDAKKIFSLTDTQITSFNTILNAVKNTKKNEKKVIIVKGGPGTGKSVIAIRLLSELYKPEYNCKNVYYATRSSSLRKDWKNTLKRVTRRFGGKNALSLIQSTYDFKPYKYGNKENGGDVLLVDEAHRISYSSNDQTDSKRKEEDRSYFPQILSMLYGSRVCVFFIDDRQAISSAEIGLSSNIELAASGYYNYIKDANEIFLGKRECPKEDPILKDIKTIPILQKELDNAVIKGSNKKSSSAKRYLNLPILDPQIKEIKVETFELKNQFRCNGSNNFLSWIDQTIYSDKKSAKVKLDTSAYQFTVYDDPNDLYAKIRSLDSYALVADQLKKDMGDQFTYKDLYERTKKMTFEHSARLVAGWCWEWNDEQVDREVDDLKKEVDLSEEYNFSMPWETKQRPKGDNKYKYAQDANSWCNQKEGVNQIGCIHSIQGWETDFVGVIIGPDLKYDPQNDCLCSDWTVRNYDKNIPNAPKNKGKMSKKDLINKEINDKLTKNIYRVLLTRGKKGCYVFACDPGVREYFKRCMKQ